MATYGPYYGAADNGRQLRVTIIAVQDVATNTSTVRAILELVSGNPTPTHSDNTQIGASINGAQTYWWQGSASYGAGTFELADSYRVIAHDANGNANTTVVGALVHGTGSLSVTVNTLTLPNIPRGTTPAISGGGGLTTGATSTISLIRADSSYTHDVTYKFGAQTGVIATGAGVTASWTPPHTMLTEIPDAASSTVDITVVTKQGSTVIGSKKVGFTLSAGASVVPVVSGVTWDDANTVVKALIGAFVQGQSLVHGAVAAVGAHGSTVVSKSLTIAGATLTESQVWQPAVPGAITAYGQAIDSRGRTGQKAASFTVLAYANPTLTTATVRRATTAAGAVGEGVYLRMDLTAAVQSLVSGTEKNALKLLVRTRPTGGAWTTRNNITHTALSYANALVMVTGGAAFPIAESFDVEITVTDNLGRVATVSRAVGTGGAVFDIGDEAGTGHGKIWERGGIDVAGDGYVAGDMYLGAVPTKASKEGHTHTGAEVAAATATARGAVELATAAEVNTGTDSTRAVTPESLSNAGRIPKALASGRALVAATGVTTVTLPSGRFDVAPNVTGNVVGHANVCVVHLGDPTLTSFAVRIYTIGGGQVGGTVSWDATQMTPTSANG